MPQKKLNFNDLLNDLRVTIKKLISDFDSFDFTKLDDLVFYLKQSTLISIHTNIPLETKNKHLIEVNLSLIKILITLEKTIYVLKKFLNNNSVLILKSEFRNYDNNLPVSIFEHKKMTKSEINQFLEKVLSIIKFFYIIDLHLEDLEKFFLEKSNSNPDNIKELVINNIYEINGELHSYALFKIIEEYDSTTNIRDEIRKFTKKIIVKIDIDELGKELIFWSNYFSVKKN